MSKMKSFFIASMIAMCAVFCAKAEVIDITAAVREANAATATLEYGTPYNADYGADKAFNGDQAAQTGTARCMLSTKPTQANPIVIRYDIADTFQTGYDVTVTSLKLIMGGEDYKDYASKRAPNLFALYGVDGNNNETLLFANETQPLWNSTTKYVEYSFENDTPFRSYRFKIYSNCGRGDSPYISFTELILKGTVTRAGNTIAVNGEVFTGDEATFYAETPQHEDGFWRDCTGATIEKLVDGVWTLDQSIPTTNYHYVADGGQYRLTWQYSAWRYEPDAEGELFAMAAKAGAESPVGGGAAHASYPATLAFDGITTSDSTNDRYLGKMPSTYLSVTIAPNAFSSTNFVPTKYVLWQLSCGGLAVDRRPKAWTLEGTLDGNTWFTLDTVSGAWANTSIMSLTNEIPVPRAVTQLRWTPTASYSNDGTADVGLMELQFIGQLSAPGSLEITSSFTVDDTSIFTPQPGAYYDNEYTATVGTVCSVDGYCYSSTGFTLEKKINDTWVTVSNSNERAFDYVKDGDNYRLTWLFSNEWNGDATHPVNVKDALEKIGATATCGGVGYDTYTAEMAFNGVKYCTSVETEERYLGSIGTTYLTLETPANAFPGKRAIFSGYRLWQLSSGGYRNARCPTGWEVYGSNDGETWTLVDTRTDYEWYSHANGFTDNSPYNSNHDDWELNSATFSIPAVNCGAYRFMKWVPTASYSVGDLVDVGLCEIEFLVTFEASDSGSLLLTADTLVPGTSDPYAAYTLDANGDTKTFTADEFGFLNGTAYQCTGFTLETLDGNGDWVNPVAHSGERSYTYTQSSASYRLTWHWLAVGARFIATADCGAETFTYSTEPDWVDSEGGKYWAYDTALTVTPHGTSEPTVTAYNGRAEGDVDGTTPGEGTLTITIDKPRAINFGFTRHWRWDAKVEGDTYATVTDGNWTLFVASYGSDLGDWPKNSHLYLAGIKTGSGVLDLTTLNADLDAQSPAETKRVGVLSGNQGHYLGNNDLITEVVIPADIGGVNYSPFYGCTALRKVTYLADSSHWAFGDEDTVNGIFDSCPALVDVNVPNITRTLPRMFANDTALTEVTLPACCTNIGYKTFGLDSALTNVIVNGKVEKVCAYAFQDSALAVMPEGISSNVVNILAYAFDNTPIAGDIEFPKLENLGNRAFRYCANIRDVSMPELTTCEALPQDSKDTITRGAQFASSGVRDISMPKLKNVPGVMFYEAKSLRNVTVCSELESIGAYAFAYSTVEQILPKAFPDTLKSMGTCAFREAHNFAQPVVFPKGFNGFLGQEEDDHKTSDPANYTNEWCTFRVASALREIDLSRTAISSVQPRFCVAATSLELVTLPPSVTNIAVGAFSFTSGAPAATAPLFTLRLTGPAPSVHGAALYNWDGSESNDGYAYKMVVMAPLAHLDSYFADASFVAKADIEDIESKPHYAELVEKYGEAKILGTWHNKWLIRWNGIMPEATMFFVR